MAERSTVRPGTNTLRVKAERALVAAEAALEAGAADVAAGRAFYAILNAAKARLNEHRLRLHAHVRIAAAYAALPALDGAPADCLADALALRRQLAAQPDAFAYEDAANLVARAQRFVAEVAAGIAPAA